MLDRKGLQSIQTMIDASIRASGNRIIAYFDTDVMPRSDPLTEGLQGAQAKLTPITRIEAIEDDVALLKQVIRSISKELAELKKVQQKYRPRYGNTRDDHRGGRLLCGRFTPLF